MPWCADCDRYLAPPSVEAGGTCPTCHKPVEVADRQGAAHPVTVTDDPGPVPWHFKLFLIAFAVYLVWRLLQIAGWFF